MPESNVFSNSSNRNHNIPLRPGSDPSGLFLPGQMIDHTRRTIQIRMDISTQIVIYTIMDLAATVTMAMNMLPMSIMKSVKKLFIRFTQKLSRKTRWKSSCSEFN